MVQANIAITNIDDSLCYLHTGLRFIPLRTPGGESASHIGIFVKIRINKLSQKQASSSGMCSLQDLKTPMKRFSSPMFPENSRLSLEETVEETIAVEKYKNNKEQKTTDT